MPVATQFQKPALNTGLAGLAGTAAGESAPPRAGGEGVCAFLGGACEDADALVGLGCAVPSGARAGPGGTAAGAGVTAGVALGAAAAIGPGGSTRLAGGPEGAKGRSAGLSADLGGVDCGAPAAVEAAPGRSTPQAAKPPAPSVTMAAAEMTLATIIRERFGGTPATAAGSTVRESGDPVPTWDTANAGLERAWPRGSRGIGCRPLAWETPQTRANESVKSFALW